MEPLTDAEVGRIFHPTESEEAKNKETQGTLQKLRDYGAEKGKDGHPRYPRASELLDRYLNGDGSPVELGHEILRDYKPLREGERGAQKHFEDWLAGTGKPDTQHKTISGPCLSHHGHVFIDKIKEGVNARREGRA